MAIVHDHLTDKLTGFNSPKLHLVTFDSPKEITSMFSKMATTLNGHFHSYNTFNLKHPEDPSAASDCKVCAQSTHSYSILYYTNIGIMFRQNFLLEENFHQFFHLLSLVNFYLTIFFFFFISPVLILGKRFGDHHRAVNNFSLLSQPSPILVHVSVCNIEKLGMGHGNGTIV